LISRNYEKTDSFANRIKLWMYQLLEQQAFWDDL